MEEAVTDAEGKGPTTGARTLRDDTLVVFVSDTHIGGDPGLDYFESAEDLGAPFGELATRHGPVELVLTEDFFDLLKIGEVLPGENRASATINRPEYRGVFSALRSVAGGADRRVVYLPGNHDAEVWWNQGIRSTLREEGLVDEFALSYVARFESIPDRLIYCEHGSPTARGPSLFGTATPRYPACRPCSGRSPGTRCCSSPCWSSSSWRSEGRRTTR